jgi:hypothetical protein
MRQEGAGELLQGLILLKDLLDLTGQSVKTLDDLVASLREGDAILGELESYHE